MGSWAGGRAIVLKKACKKPNKQKLVNSKKNAAKKQAHKQEKIHKQKPANKKHACRVWHNSKSKNQKKKQRKTKIRWAVGQAVER